MHDQEKTPAAAAAWTPPAPRELADWRPRMREHIASPIGRLMLAEMIRTGHTTLAPATTPAGIATAAAILARGEVDRLTDAALYYVTAEMTAWAHAAAATPPAEPVSARRLPAPTGLMLFAAPIGSYSQTADDVFTPYNAQRAPGAPTTLDIPIVAVSWSLWTPDRDAPPGTGVVWLNHHGDGHHTPISPGTQAIWLTFYTPAAASWAQLPPHTPITTSSLGVVTAGELTEAARLLAPLTWDNETLLPLGVPLAQSRPPDAPAWADVVYTAWQMISQTDRLALTEIETLPRDRAGRRRDTRQHLTPGDVRVIRVHPHHRDAPPATPQPRPAGSDYRVRVAPYRRNTCLNPRAHADGGCTHDEQIVAGHVRGPDGAPWRTQPTVRLWDR